MSTKKQLILNPETGRMVSMNGRIGQKILHNMKAEASLATKAAKQSKRRQLSRSYDTSDDSECSYSEMDSEGCTSTEWEGSNVDEESDESSSVSDNSDASDSKSEKRITTPLAANTKTPQSTVELDISGKIVPFGKNKKSSKARQEYDEKDILFSV